MAHLLIQQNKLKTISKKNKFKSFPGPGPNLIEAIWSQLKSKLKRSYEDYEELVQDVKNNGNSLTITYIQNLYNSMNKRILVVIEAEGGPTRY